MQSLIVISIVIIIMLFGSINLGTHFTLCIIVAV